MDAHEAQFTGLQVENRHILERMERRDRGELG